jgi:hypothetical protein
MPEMLTNGEALSMATPSMRAPLREYADLLAGLGGDNLLGLTAFGVVLGEHFDPQRMTAGSVMVLREIDLGLLRRIAEYGPKLGSKRITAPLVMTPAYITASLDSFPLELLEIHQRHLTLLGEDHFEMLRFEPDHLRLQCEREFKRILIGLRQGLLGAGTREDVLDELVVDTGQHLLRTLRGLLWLKGLKEPLARDRVLAETERLTGGALAGVRGAIESAGVQGWGQFQALYADVERLAAVADQL